MGIFPREKIIAREREREKPWNCFQPEFEQLFLIYDNLSCRIARPFCVMGQSIFLNTYFIFQCFGHESCFMIIRPSLAWRYLVFVQIDAKSELVFANLEPILFLHPTKTHLSIQGWFLKIQFKKCLRGKLLRNYSFKENSEKVQNL